MAGDSRPAKKVVWSYDDDYTGQEEWGLLTPAFAACEIGKRQSPVSIGRTETSSTPASHKFSYKPGKIAVRNAGYTVSLLPSQKQIYEEDGVEYTLRSIQFHSPSEHVVKGKFYALEIQFLHENSEGRQIMVAVFAETGKALPEFDQALAAIPEKRGTQNDAMFNIALLLPGSFSHYAYTGSLTTPPCTEGIEWRVLQKPITLSKGQLSRLTKFTQRNARLTQPLYMRTVKEIN